MTPVRWVAAGAAGLILAGCAEVSTSGSQVYVPATVQSTRPDAPKRVVLTDEAARRIDLTTSTIRATSAGTAVDYKALLYDKTGGSWVFTVVGPLTYQRAAITVDEIEGRVVTLSTGPRAGTKVVTTGAIELWGAELGIAGKH